MKSSSRYIILDVGHGNCSTLIENDKIIIFDAPIGSTLLDFLNEEQIKSIDKVILSHADSDHIGGIINLLSNELIIIREIYLNSDSTKDTKTWKALRVAVYDAIEKRSLKIFVGVFKGCQYSLDIGETSIEILHPLVGDVLSGPGGMSIEKGKKITSNNLSIVLSLKRDEKRIVFIAADMDNDAFASIKKETEIIESDILVFPHHGGSPGKDIDAYKFAEELSRNIKPTVTFFSIDRKRFLNPNPDIIEGVKKGYNKTHIMCSQLSRNCAFNVLNINNHLSGLIAKGKKKNECCAGSIEFDLNNIRYDHVITPHKKFVRENINGSLCNKGMM